MKKINQFKLSNSQQNAFNQILNFLDSEKKIFILKGYAGTGKTFLLKFISQFLEQSERKFVLGAPTGRAARILSLKTGYEAKTIHSIIYTYDDENSFDTSVWNFNTRKNFDEYDTVYIFDEVSMISDIISKQAGLSFGSGRLLKDLFNYTGILDEENSLFSRKIIFSGDPAQLPPVGTNISPALSSEFLFENFGIECEVAELFKVFRQKFGSGILIEANRIRKFITSGTFKKFDIESSEDIELVDPNSDYVLDDLCKSTASNESILITYTNKKASQYNQFIRERIYGEAYSFPVKGDKLLNISNNYMYNLFNGDIAEILEVSQAEKFLIELDNDDQKIELSFRDVVLELMSFKGDTISIECKIIENLLNSQNKSLTENEYRALKTLAQREADILPPDIKLRKTKPAKFKKELIEYRKKMRESEYLNALLTKYGFAITCHKAQGGEWNKVYIDFRDHWNYSSEEFFRWSYTALTRAREKLFLINSPQFDNS